MEQEYKDKQTILVYINTTREGRHLNKLNRKDIAEAHPEIEEYVIFTYLAHMYQADYLYPGGLSGNCIPTNKAKTFLKFGGYIAEYEDIVKKNRIADKIDKLNIRSLQISPFVSIGAAILSLIAILLSIFK